MSHRVKLNAAMMTDRETMSSYMSDIFGFPPYFGRNLDALRDSLSEVAEPTDLYLDRDCIRDICDDRYAYKVLLVLSRAADENPHIRIHFR